MPLSRCECFIHIFYSSRRVYLECLEELFMACSDEEKGERTVKELEIFRAQVERICSADDSEQ